MSQQEPVSEEFEIEERDFVIPKAVIVAVGFGTFIIGGLLAKQGAEEGLEILEDKVNDRIKKIQNRKHPTPPELAE